LNHESTTYRKSEIRADPLFLLVVLSQFRALVIILKQSSNNPHGPLMTLPAPTVVENTIPVLAVADVAASMRFYCDVLDFQRDWVGSADPPQIASVSRDGHAIMLQSFSPGGPGCVWIGTSGLAALWHKIRTRTDVVVVQRPTNQSYALDLKIKDPDGNILWFGTEPLAEVPFGQELTENQLQA
jgi:hypothetical protein